MIETNSTSTGRGPALKTRSELIVREAPALFTNRGLPLRVRDETALSPSGVTRSDAVKVVFTLSGAAAVGCVAETVTVAAGTVLTIPANLDCWGVPSGQVRTGTFYVHADYLAEQIPWLPSTHPLIHLLRRSLDGEEQFGRLQLPAGVMHELAPRLARLAQLPHRADHEFALLSTAAEVLHIVGEVAGTTSGTAKCASLRLAQPRREVDAAVALLSGNLERAWRIEDLASSVALSSSQLTRLFRIQIGVSPSAFLTRLRTARMAELLVTTRLGVSEVARTAGWENVASASRAFKRRYGVSPRTFETRHHTGDWTERSDATE